MLAVYDSIWPILICEFSFVFDSHDMIREITPFAPSSAFSPRFCDDRIEHCAFRSSQHRPPPLCRVLLFSRQTPLAPVSGSSRGGGNQRGIARGEVVATHPPLTPLPPTVPPLLFQPPRNPSHLSQKAILALPGLALPHPNNRRRAVVVGVVKQARRVRTTAFFHPTHFFLNHFDVFAVFLKTHM